MGHNWILLVHAHRDARNQSGGFVFVFVVVVFAGVGGGGGGAVAVDGAATP
jgi:hypothetical protein